MKQLLLALLFALICQADARSQEIPDSSITFAYAQLVGMQKFLSTKVVVSIDFGQQRSFFSSNAITDPKTGKPVEFNSMVDAMNFMGEMGWEFVQAYVVTVSNQSVYHWLLKRACRVDEKGDYVPLTKSEYNKIKKPGG